jgi:hypothetical protein
MITIRHDGYDYPTICWSVKDQAASEGNEAGYCAGMLPPNYPMPVLRYVVKRDYMNDKLIALMLGAIDVGLLEYWPLS